MEKVKCEDCGGDGWILGHGPWHNPETGDCEGCPVQDSCDKCNGTGEILKSEILLKEDNKKDFSVDDIPF